MEKFKFNGYYTSSWPDWFVDLIGKDKARVTSDIDLSFENGDDWKNNLIYIAFLWTPDGISNAYEGDTIVNHGGYCEPEQNDL